MNEDAGAVAEGSSKSGDQRLGVLLAMAMFVLVVDTSLMNVSISAMVQDLGTTVSGVQSAIALEALVSAAFILISSKVGDLIGRKLAYILGLVGYAMGALAMVVAQDLITVVIFWAILGGLGASLLLPAMQSLIHGNFEGAAQKRVYALVGASAAIAAAVGTVARWLHHHLHLVARRFPARARRHHRRARRIGMIRDVAYTGPRQIDLVGAVLSVLGMGGDRPGHPGLAGGRGVRRRLLMGVGAVALGGSGLGGWSGASGGASRPCSTPICSGSPHFRLGISGQMMQQIALGGR